jgi:hypothetical protein
MESAFGDVKDDAIKRNRREILCILYLIDFETGERSEVQINFQGEHGIELIETLFVKQILPLLKGEKVNRGEYALDLMAKNKEKESTRGGYI